MASSDVSVIRPGIIVIVNTPMNGGVRYKRVDLNPEGVVDSFMETTPSEDEKSEISSWQTTRLISDKDEFERAGKIRNNARGIIHRICSPTAFGWLCPEALEPELNEAIKTAKKLVADFNSQAKFTEISCRVMKGRIASTDEEAAQAIVQEVKSLLDEMSQGIDALNPDDIRTAALKAKAISTMLAPEQSEKVSLAIKAARKAATTITHRVGKKGEEAAKVLEDLKLQRSSLENARFAFLDLSETTEDLSNRIVPDNSMPVIDLDRFDLEINNREEK